MTPRLSTSRVAALLGDFPRSPAYAGIADTLRVLIGDGRIGAGVQLPSERELTGVLGVSRTTVTRAYQELRSSGYAESRRGAGTFTRVPGGRARVRDRGLQPADGPEDSVDLGCAAPAAPAGLAEAYAAAVQDLPAYLSGSGYFPLGVPALREAIAARYERQGVATAPDQIMVTSGALAATSVVAATTVRRGDRVLLESPIYPNAAQALRRAGARIVTGDVDPDAWDLAGWEHVLRGSGAGSAYLVPDFHNPTGLLMTEQHRAELADRLRRTDTVPVVDEAHRDLVLEDDLVERMPRPFAAHHARTITVGSASKSHWGGLRLGWIRAPRSLMEPLLRARVGQDLGAPVLEQLVLTHLLAQDRVLEANRRRLRAQRDCLVTAIRQQLGDWEFRVPRGGLSLWCRLPRAAGTALSIEAERHGVLVAPGPVFAVEGGLDGFVRIPWTRPPEELERAVHGLADAWAAVQARPSGPERLGDEGPVLVA